MQGNFSLSNFVNWGEELLFIYCDGLVMLACYQNGQGNFYFSVVLFLDEYNDLVCNGEIFVFMLFKMLVFFCQGQQLFYMIGQDVMIVVFYDVMSSDIVYKLQGEVEEFIFEQCIIGVKVYFIVGQQVNEVGYYDFFLQLENLLGIYVFNYDCCEFDFDYYSLDELVEYVGLLVNFINIVDNVVFIVMIEEWSQGILLWCWCLILVLVFLGVEVLLLWFWEVQEGCCYGFFFCKFVCFFFLGRRN